MWLDSICLQIVNSLKINSITITIPNIIDALESAKVYRHIYYEFWNQTFHYVPLSPLYKYTKWMPDRVITCSNSHNK